MNDLSWMDDALCAEIGDVEMFFPPRSSTAPHAFATCRRCEVQDECLNYAQATTVDGVVTEGIWGGTSKRQRAAMRREGAA